MKKYLILILPIVVLTVGLFLFIVATQHKQIFKNKAATPGGVGSLSLSPTSVTHYQGEIFPVTLSFKTGGSAIGAVSLRMSYPYSGSVPEMDITDANGNALNQLTPDSNLTSSSDWSFGINTVTRANNTVTVDFTAINFNFAGFTSPTSGTVLSTIYFKVNRAAASPVVISFDPSLSNMLTKSNPTDILNTPSSASYTVISDTTGPSAVSDLRASNPSLQSIVLNWTAPSDIGPTQKASSYDLRYSTSSITAANFSSATSVTGVPAPNNAGVAESFTVTGLSSSSSYYFAIESKDAANNVSGISNVVNASTVTPTLTFGFKMQGISTANVNKTVTVTLTNSSNSKTFTVPFTSNSSGIFNPTSPINTSSVALTPSATYDVYIKDSSHLRRKLGSITLVSGANVGPASWNSITFLGGDFNNDNKLNIFDIALIISQYTALSIPVNTGNQVYDVNSDGVINISDIALILSNYTKLEVLGD